jgi:hypothetical protein
MDKLIVVLLSFLVFFGLFFYCHLVLRFQGTAYATANSIRYRYWQMPVCFVVIVVGCLIWNEDFFWVGTSAGLSASALYYGGRFGVLRFFSFIALVGVFAWGIALGSSLVTPAQMAVAGLAFSFALDLFWNRELKKRHLPPEEPVA